jgi:dienelactone hydrolase
VSTGFVEMDANMLPKPQHGVAGPRVPMMPKLALAALLLIFAAGACSVAGSPDTADLPNIPLNEQVIRIPGEGLPTATLEVTIFHPEGNGPFPLAIMNHGATAISSANRGERYRLTNAAFYFLSRGYAVALPMMRGFAASDGEFYHFGCDLTGMGIANAKDIRAVIRALNVDPLIDSRFVVVAGQSLGGWNTLALGALNVPSVKGLINFNGGIRVSDCGAGDHSLLAGAEDFGGRTTTPSIWFYGENDHLFPVDVWRAMYDRYIYGGGQAELVDVGVVLKNSHMFLAYPEALPLWTPKLDNFLARIGMPSALINPDYLPQPFPPASNFAALTDVKAIPHLSDEGREAYRQFLQAPYPRAFVINEKGQATSTSNGLDPLRRALADCEKRAAPCQVYAVDDQVVWKPFPTKASARADDNMPAADQTNTVVASPAVPDARGKSAAASAHLGGAGHAVQLTSGKRS